MSNINNLEINYENLSNDCLRNLYLRSLLTGETYGPLTGRPDLDKPHLKFYPKEAFLSEYPKMSMYDYLYEKSKNNMDDVALVFDTDFGKKKITFEELFDNVNMLADRLVNNNHLKSGDKVAVSFANTPESVYTIYALNKIGAIICLIDPRINANLLREDLKSLKVKMYIGINEGYRTFKSVNKVMNIENIKIVSPLNSLDNKIVKFVYMVKQFVNGNVDFKLKHQWKFGKILDNDIVPFYSAGDTAIISYTGGTSGIHKGVELTNDTMNNTVFSHDYLMTNVVRGDVFMNILPQFMIYGIFTLHLALCRGLETHLLIDASPQNFVKHLLELNPAMAFGGPIHWETLIDNELISKNSLSNMKAPVSGGEKMSLSRELKINDILDYAGAQEKLCNGYGASELNGSVTLKQGDKNKAGTVGILHAYDNAKIVNVETGKVCSYNEEGELYITSPSLMKGYYNNISETEEAIVSDENGVRWFATGDLAKIDENGDIEVTGRLKRLFVCGVNNVYPPQMEEIISSLPNVNSCVVVNVPHTELREVPKVHLVLNDDTPSQRNRIKKLIISSIADNISPEVVPHYFAFHEVLKHTPNGKIDFKGIRNEDICQMNNFKKKILKKDSL